MPKKLNKKIPYRINLLEKNVANKREKLKEDFKISSDEQLEKVYMLPQKITGEFTI